MDIAIQITTRCNFHCAHCAYSCTAEGIDMNFDTFKKAIKLAKNRKERVTISGGEPTIHPLFLKYLYYALDKLGKQKIGVVTNGSQTEIALKLAELNDRGIVSSSLSQDEYHDKIDDVVVERFKSAIVGIKTVETIFSHGRGKEVKGAVEGCVCKNMVITPTGKIFACGCLEESWGDLNKYKIPDVFAGIDKTKFEIHGYCSRQGPIYFPIEYDKSLKKTKDTIKTRIDLLDILLEFYTGTIDEQERNKQLAQLQDDSSMNEGEFQEMIDSIAGQL